MKIKIDFYEIMSDHVLATPQYFRSETIEAESTKDPKITEFLANRTDSYGYNYTPATDEDKKRFGFDFMSEQGAANVKSIEPESLTPTQLENIITLLKETSLVNPPIVSDGGGEYSNIHKIGEYNLKEIELKLKNL
ncbi:MAG: hypothetical protein ACOC1K_07295 [Nanoarchaeota archaeon]